MPCRSPFPGITNKRDIHPSKAYWERSRSVHNHQFWDAHVGRQKARAQALSAKACPISFFRGHVPFLQFVGFGVWLEARPPEWRGASTRSLAEQNHKIFAGIAPRKVLRFLGGLGIALGNRV